MTGPEGLERRYRRLLAWYPAVHRAEHEEEMLGVLLAAAREGQRRPRPGEAANLIGGALKIRLRPAPAGARLAAWRDALATFSVAGPLLLLVMTAASALFWLLFAVMTAAYVPPMPALEIGYPLWRVGFSSFTVPGLGIALLDQGQLVLAVLVLLRLRRAAAAVAFLTAAGLALLLVTGWAYGSPAPVFGLTFAVLEAAALAASPGPRRGMEILTRSGGLLLVIVAAVALGAAVEALGPVVSHPGVAVPALAVAAVIAAGMAVASPLSRRVLLLFAIPAVPFALNIIAMNLRLLGGPSAGAYRALVWLPPLALAGLAVTEILRARSRAVPDRVR
jgi:hypothetical protein